MLLKKKEPDNLIALEMKKFDASHADKQSDRNRLIALTKSALQDVWPGLKMAEYCRSMFVGTNSGSIWSLM